MHHHTLNDTDYKEIRKEVKRADKILIQAIEDIENKIYTEEESRLIYSSIVYAIAEMMKAINFSAKINIPDIASSIGSVLKNLSEINKYYKIDYSSIAKLFSQPIIRFPDYTKLIDTKTADMWERFSVWVLRRGNILSSSVRNSICPCRRQLRCPEH